MLIMYIPYTIPRSPNSLLARLHNVLVTGLLPVTLSAPEYRHVNLGAAVGKVVTGSHTTAGFKEDKRNKATPGTN